jgi:hypothetical protein
MITISVNREEEWCIEYRLEGVKAVELRTKDRAIALKEIDHKLRLEMGLAKGKTLLNTTGREI